MLQDKFLSCPTILSDRQLKYFFIDKPLPETRAETHHFLSCDPSSSYATLLRHVLALGDNFSVARRPETMASANGNTKKKHDAVAEPKGCHSRLRVQMVKASVVKTPAAKCRPSLPFTRRPALRVQFFSSYFSGSEALIPWTLKLCTAPSHYLTSSPGSVYHTLPPTLQKHVQCQVCVEFFWCACLFRRPTEAISYRYGRKTSKPFKRSVNIGHPRIEVARNSERA